VVTTISPRPVQCRSGEPNDRELLGRVYRQARCARSCLDPDEWFPLTADVARAREQAARAIAICAGCPVRADSGSLTQPCALELAFESGFAQAGADMPLTAILRSGDLDQLTTHARLAVGRPAVTVPEDLAGSSRYRPPPCRPASRTAALPARNGPPASKRPSGTRAHKLSPVHDDPRRESSSSHVSIVWVRSGRLCQPATDPSRTAGRSGGYCST
jgi:hypothetical protein